MDSGEGGGRTERVAALPLLVGTGSATSAREISPKAANKFGMPATVLPVETTWEGVQPLEANTLASDLAALGYPGFAHLKARRKKNPGEVLLSALSAQRLESRVVEALPWLLLEYPDLDWEALVVAVKVRDLQNKLGFVTSLARRLAENRGETNKAALLSEREKVLAKSRLLLEDTFCNDSLTQAERRWLQTHRPPAAKHWRVLTDLSPEHLTHAF